MNSNSIPKPFVFYSNELKSSVTEEKGVKRYFVEGHISTSDPDLVNDIVTSDCLDSMTAQFSMRNIKLDFEHETMIGDNNIEKQAAKTRMPLGKAIKCNRDAKGVKVKWELNPDWKKFDTKGDLIMSFDEVWRSVESGYYDAFSIAYIPTKSTYIDRSGTEMRLLDDLNLINVALTGSPINPAASMTAVMAKSVEYLKSQDNYNNQDVHDKDLCEIKNQIKDEKYELNNIKNKIGGNSMADEEGKSQPPADGNDANQEGKSQNGEENKEIKSLEEIKSVQAEIKSEQEKLKSAVEKVEADLKSEVDKIKDELKSVKDENANLKGIVEKAQHKSQGAEDNSQKSQEGNEVKSFVGPLDMV